MKSDHTFLNEAVQIKKIESCSLNIVETTLQTIQNMNALIECQKDWFKKVISSEAYFSRLAFILSDKKARSFQEKSLSRLIKGKYYFSNYRDCVNENMSSLTHVGYFKRSIIFHYQIQDFSTLKYPEDDTLGIAPLPFYDFDPVHEFEHQAGVGNISPFVKNLFGIKFSIKRFLTKWAEESGNLDYYASPSEILARKRVFDYELELRGVKKYEDEFTKEHYEKVLFLSDHDYLIDDSDQFFYMFEKDDLIYIMNTVP